MSRFLKEAAVVAGIVGLLILLVMGAFQEDAHNQRRIADWAEETGYEVLEINLCQFARGPYSYILSKHARVYRVDVQKNGKQREVYFLFNMATMDHQFTGD